MKKNLLLGALVSTVVASSAFADAPSPAFNGFYLGAGLNHMNEKAKVRTTFNDQVIDQGTGTASLKGFGVKLFGGYGTIVSQGFYIGGELTLGYDRLFGSKKSDGLESNKKVNYGIAARLGYVISNVLPYVKFGYEGRPSVGGEEEGVKVSVKRSGFILGGGVDVAVTKNVFIRGEYVHGFGAKSNLSKNVNVPGVGAGTVAINFKTSSDTFLIGAGYKF